jgi:catechol 2,3-dioxygenase-like lactoylglutathione lyase family enzyme
MKRFHVHVAVRDLEKSIAFYSALFGHAPTKQRDDYAKWQIEDPRINFAISPAKHVGGVDHLGFEFETAGALQAATEQWQKHDLGAVNPAATTCCYAESDKTWLRDPQGTSWEAFVTHRDAATYGAAELAAPLGQAACCGTQSCGS